MIECARVVRIARATPQRLFPAVFAGDRGQSLDEARPDRRCTGLLSRARQNDLRRTKSLRKIVRREADTQFRQIEAELEPHRPAEPRIVAGLGRPGAFVQPAEHDAIDALQAGFEQTEDPHTRAADFRAPLCAP